jgi:hypothetical protein
MADRVLVILISLRPRNQFLELQVISDHINRFRVGVWRIMRLCAPKDHRHFNPCREISIERAFQDSPILKLLKHQAYLQIRLDNAVKHFSPFEILLQVRGYGFRETEIIY